MNNLQNIHSRFLCIIMIVFNHSMYFFCIGLYISNNSISTINLVTFESTQMALERVLQQLNSQRVLDISNSRRNKPYDFNK